MLDQSRRGLLVLAAIAALAAVVAVPRAAGDTAAADLRATAAGPASAKAGESFTYTFTVVNDGFDPAAAVAATISMPASATGIPSVSGGSVCTAGTAAARVCDLGTLNNGDTRTITVSGRFADAGSATLSIAVTSTTSDPDPSDNQASVTTSVSRVTADLQLRLVRVASPLLVGAFSDYLIEAKNAGPDAVGGLTVTDTNPATFGSAQASGSNTSSVNCFFGSTINCSDGPTFCSTPSPSPAPGAVSTCSANGPLAPGQSLYFRFLGRPLHSGLLVNTATVTGIAVDDPSPGDNTLETSIQVDATADLAAALTAPGSAISGDEFDVEVGVTNNGPDTAEGVTASTTLPAGVTLVSATGCSGTAPVVCTFGDLADDASATKTLRVRGTTLGNAAISTTVSSATGDNSTANNTTSRTVAIVEEEVPPGADLRVTAAGPASGKAGEAFTYTFTVTNDGFETAASVSATVSMPENARGLPFVSGGSVCTAGPAEARVCALGTLNNGESRTITVSGSFGAAGPATLSIAAASTTADPDASNNTASVSTTVSRVSANLQLRLIRVTSPVNVNDFADYVIEVKNAGPDAVGSVRLTDTVPATLGSAQAAGSNSSSLNCFFGSTQVTCNDGPTVCSTPIPSPAPGALATCNVSGPLPSGATRYFRFLGRPLASGTIQNLAAVSGLELDDPDTSDNTLTTSIVVNATADLALSANAPGSAPLGEEFDVELSVENNGPDAVTDATTTTTLPAGVALVTAAGCTGTTTVVCPLGSIAVDATATKTLRLRGTAAGNAAIATTVDSGIHDHVGANDAVTRTVTILPNAPPTADAGGPYTVLEGRSAWLTGTGTDPNGDALTFAWDLDGDGRFESTGATASFSAATIDGPASRTVDFRVCDALDLCATDTATVQVLNAAPAGMIHPWPAAVDEGTPVSLDALVIDSGALDTHTLLWRVSRNGVHQPGLDASGNGFSFSFVADDDGSWLVELVVIDDEGDSGGSATASILVANVAPQADLEAPPAADEGSQLTISLSSPRDPSSADTAAGFAYAFDCGRGSGFGAFGPSASATCTAGGGPATQVVRGRIRDKDGGVSEQAAQVAIRNLPPTVSLDGAPTTMAEGSTVVLTASGSDAGGDALTYSWRAFRGGVHQPALDGSGPTYSFAPNDDGAWTVRVVASDGDGGTADDSAAITVTNVAPAATLTAPDHVDEGSAFTVSLSGATDPSTADTAAGFEYALDCGTGSGYGAFGPAASATCATDDDGTRAVRAKIRDKDGGEREYAASVVVRNVAPTALLSAPASVDGGSTFALALTGAADVSAADAAAGFAYAFDCGSGSGYGAFGAASSAQCPTADDGTRTVRAKIRDKDGGESEYVATVDVVNVPPTCGPVSAPLAPSPVGATVSISAPIVDPEPADTHTGTVAWGDGTSSPAAVAGGVATAGHAYAAPGVYTVTVDVADDDGGTASCVFRYVVVYDPSAGFVTGGGWIDSPAGAYAADPAATGRASFGFVARYQRGATVPTGQTQFQFKAGRLDFHSTAYEWLVIAGARAKFKGTGEIGGVGGYSFMLTAIDGQSSGGGGADRFRIKIWSTATGGVVYDNQPGASDDGDAATTLGGGSVAIHG